MIQNRSFEDDRQEPVGWKASGGVQSGWTEPARCTAEIPPRCRWSLAARCKRRPGRVQPRQGPLPGGMAFRKGEALRFRCTSAGMPAGSPLAGQGGKVLARTSLPTPTSAWEKVEVTMNPRPRTCPGAWSSWAKAWERSGSTSSLDADHDLEGHGLRRDLAEMIAALKPAFVRFPGGCFVEAWTEPMPAMERLDWRAGPTPRDFEPLGLPDVRSLRRPRVLAMVRGSGRRARLRDHCGMATTTRCP